MSKNAEQKADYERELMTAERFEVVRSLYVVLPSFDGSLSWWNWMLWPESRWGDTMPVQVPNPSMRWRRPTYEEALRRQRAFAERENWSRLIDEYAGARWRRLYGRPEPEQLRPNRVAVAATGTYQPLQTGDDDE